MVQFTAEGCCSSPKWRGAEGRRCLSSHLVSLFSGIKDSRAWRRGSKTADQEGSSGRSSLWWRMPRIEASSGPPRPKLQTEFIYIYFNLFILNEGQSLHNTVWPLPHIMFLISKARESLKEAQTVFEAVNKDAGGKRPEWQWLR